MTTVPKLLLILLLCCGATCLIELIPLLFTKKRKQWINASVINNVVTNPILNTILLLESTLLHKIYPEIFYIWWRNSGFVVNPYRIARVILLIILELAAIIFEAWIYRRLVVSSWKESFLSSAALNTLSYWIGTKLEPLFQLCLELVFGVG